MTAILAMALALQLSAGEHKPTVIVVIGAVGAKEYEPVFQKCAEQWRSAAEKGKADFRLVGQGAEATESDRDQFRKILAQQPPAGETPLWIVLIGHGTDDGREARFNLRGPDFTARELAEWLAPVKRPTAVVNASSASGTFVNHLSAVNRVVITATRGGAETNYARFGEHFSATINDPAADLDQDGQVSLLEAFLTASRRVAEFYKTESRLATEHPLLDDNGDKLGSSADFFEGVRAVKRAKDGAPPDGVRAHQWHLAPSERERSLPPEIRKRRDELEQALSALREQKGRLKEDEYYERLEKIAVELARLSERIK